MIMPPLRGGGGGRSPKAAFIEMDLTALRKFRIFLRNCPVPVMFLLPGDVVSEVFAL